MPGARGILDAEEGAVLGVGVIEAGLRREAGEEAYEAAGAQ